MILYDLIIVLFSLLFSAFFSGMEIAFLSSNKLRIALEQKQGVFSSRIVSFFLKRQPQYIATMLIGNNIAMVFYGKFMAQILKPVIENYVTSSEFSIVLIQTSFSTFLILITAEFLPKTLFRINANFALNVFAVPVMFFYFLFYPVMVLTIWFTDNLLKKVLKVKVQEQEKYVFGKVDLDNFVNEGQPEETQPEDVKHDVKIFQNALDFSSIKLRACIRPRTEIIALEVNEPVGKLRKKFIETGFSKILIYKNNIDNIIGYCHSSDMFKMPKTIQAKLHTITIAPETMPANKLLQLFTQDNKSIAVVVDEFGGTAGIITIEDILEEIFGEIQDEHDVFELIEKQLSENEYEFSGRMEIGYINEKYNIEIPVSDEYETLAGFVLFNFGSIPMQKERIEIEPFVIEILEVSETRIGLVKIILDKTDNK